MPTPQTVDAFTRFFSNAFNEKDIIGTSTGFQVFFGRPEAGLSRTVLSPDALAIDVDIIRGNRKTAALISRGVSTSAESLDKTLSTKTQEYTAVSRKFPLIEEAGSIEATQLLKRLAGENPYQPMSQEEKLRFLFAKEIIPEQIVRIFRRTERSAAESVLDGVMTAVDGAAGDATLTYDFKRNSDNTIDKTGSEWNTGTPDIIGDIDELCEEIRINGKMTPDMIVMGEGAYSSFKQDATVLARADNRRIEMIQVSIVNPVPERFNKFVEAGFLPAGTLRTDKGYVLWIFTYVDSYDTNAGVDTKYMPTDKVLVCSSKARADRYFGPNEQLPVTEVERLWMISKFGIDPNIVIPAPQNILGENHALVNGMFYFDAYQEVDRKRITFRTQCAPIYATTQTDAFGTLTDLLV